MIAVDASSSITQVYGKEAQAKLKSLAERLRAASPDVKCLDSQGCLAQLFHTTTSPNAKVHFPQETANAATFKPRSVLFTPLGSVLERFLDVLDTTASKALVIVLTDGRHHPAPVSGEPDGLSDELISRLEKEERIVFSNALRWKKGRLPRARDLFASEILRGRRLAIRDLETRIKNLCPDASPKIESFAGTESTRREEAAAASVVAVGDETHTFCTGVAVSDELVLTARHCLPATHVRFDEDRRSAVARPVVDAIPHPDPHVDAALLVVQGPFGLPHVARRNAGEVSPPSGQLRHVGFGALGESRQMTSSQRHPVDMFVDGWRCDTTRDASRFGCLAGWELAVPASRGTDTCDGDSGGPLFEEVRIDPSTLDISKIPTGIGGATCEEVCEWRLVGITSRPIAGAQRRCGDGGVYVRADRLAPWIDETMHRQSRQERSP